MKLKSLDTSSTHDEHERFVMHIGRGESELLLALLEKAKNATPRILQTETMLGRCRQMSREFRKALKP